MPDKLLITKNTSFEDIRLAISKLREQKGNEKETLKLTNEALSITHNFIANLFFEEALTYQHLNSFSKMEKAVINAKKYIDEFNLYELRPRLFIFLGKVEDSKRQYKKAILYFKKSGNSFESKSHLAYSMIMSGQFSKGFDLARKTYKDFFESKDGLELKKKDYETWAIWLSGITIRTVNALIEKKVNFNLKDIEDWIKDTEKYLDKNNKFSYRKAEIKELWIKLQNLKN